MTSETDTEGTSSDVPSRVKNWLNKQGYPTEFKTALCWQKGGFRVFQGYHVSVGQEAPREVDVLAMRDADLDGRLIRVCHVVECKWSGDKPWVVFTSPNSRMHPNAGIAQTIGNLYGSTLLWLLAPDKRASRLKMFQNPEFGGFGGRQVFKEGVDNFYAAMSAVCSLSSAIAKEHDVGHERRVGELPYSAVLVFPIIVVDGLLFEAFFDESAKDIQLKPRDQIRCHWRGSADWPVIATIDIVSLEFLNEFVRTRSEDLDDLLPLLKETEAAVAKCFKARSLAGLEIKPGPRGMLGLPQLLQEISRGRR